ncbi:MAG: PEP-CTERM sorting domain-containing protein [Verrucomicrobiia bacterium]|jgi:sugar lactone lactonase YvrE
MKRLLRITLFEFVLTLSLSLTHCSIQADTIYLSTFDSNTILKFDSAGNESVFATGSSGLNYPYGLAVDSGGNLYVANSGGGLQGSSDIEEFSPSATGSVLTASSLSFPTDLALDKNGSIFVANAGNNTIEEFDSSGTGSVFATASSGIDFPEGLAFDSSGNLYVANATNIEKFTPNGTGTVFATAGLNNPQGLAFDKNGNLYVANAGNNTIEEFNISGHGSIFTSTNLLRYPIGLAFDGSGDLYVANHFAGSILEFNSVGVGSVSASGLGNAVYLAIDDIPEPSTFLLLGFGAMTLCAFLKRQRG